MGIAKTKICLTFYKAEVSGVPIFSSKLQRTRSLNLQEVTHVSRVYLRLERRLHAERSAVDVYT